MNTTPIDYPQFLSVDDLIEQERDEVYRILFAKSGSSRKNSVEFLLTSETRETVTQGADTIRYPLADYFLAAAAHQQQRFPHHLLPNLNAIPGAAQAAAAAAAQYRQVVVNVPIVHDGSTPTFIPGHQATGYAPIMYHHQSGFHPHLISPWQFAAAAAAAAAAGHPLAGAYPFQMAAVSTSSTASTHQSMPNYQSMPQQQQHQSAQMSAAVAECSQSPPLPDNQYDDVQQLEEPMVDGEVAPVQATSAPNFESSSVVEVKVEEEARAVEPSPAPETAASSNEINGGQIDRVPTVKANSAAAAVPNEEPSMVGSSLDQGAADVKFEDQGDSNNQEEETTTTIGDGYDGGAESVSAAAPDDVKSASTTTTDIAPVSSATTTAIESLTKVDEAAAASSSIPKKEEPKSWASLFKNTRTAAQAIVVNGMATSKNNQNNTRVKGRPNNNPPRANNVDN